MKQIIAVIALIVVAIGGYFAWQMYGQGPSEVPVSIATFSCDQGKTIGATFYSKSVTLVFWNKGNTAFIEEGNTHVDTPPQTYANCVTGGSDSTQPSNDTTTYSYPPLGISIKYPKAYSLSESYQYQGLVEEQIPGVKVSVPASLTDGTNLSTDSGVSIEYLPG